MYYKFDSCQEHHQNVYMKKFLLTHCKPEEDVDFLNITPIKYIFAKEGPGYDSGWCDATTGCRILSKHDSIFFYVVNNEEEAVLKFKFGDRLVEHTT